MTEKRFTITGDRGISDYQKKRLYDLNDFDGMISVTECLNELHDENVELQGMYDAQKELYCQLNSDKNNIWQDYQDLKKENKQLNQAISDWKGSYDELYENCGKLEKKNEQLKSEIVHLENKLAYKDQHNNNDFKGIEDWASGGF